MTQFIDPTDGPRLEVDYQSAMQHPGNPELLVKLAGIFTIITGSLDLLASIVSMAYAVMMMMVPVSVFAATGPAGSAPATLPFDPRAMFATAAIILGVLAAIAGAVKLVGGIKLVRRSRNAWGWGLASGIIGCVAFWCGYFCFIPLAGGIYTIVILSKKNVRTYMSSLRDAPTSGFPMQPPPPPPGSTL